MAVPSRDRGKPWRIRNGLHLRKVLNILVFSFFFVVVLRLWLIPDPTFNLDYSVGTPYRDRWNKDVSSSPIRFVMFLGIDIFRSHV